VIQKVMFPSHSFVSPTFNEAEGLSAFAISVDSDSHCD